MAANRVLLRAYILVIVALVLDVEKRDLDLAHLVNRARLLILLQRGSAMFLGLRTERRRHDAFIDFLDAGIKRELSHSFVKGTSLQTECLFNVSLWSVSGSHFLFALHLRDFLAIVVVAINAARQAVDFMSARHGHMIDTLVGKNLSLLIQVIRILLHASFPHTHLDCVDASRQVSVLVVADFDDSVLNQGRGNRSLLVPL